MVTISLKTHEIIHISIALIHIDTQSPYTTLTILNKLYKALKSRILKATVKEHITTFKLKNHIPDLKTYKKKPKSVKK
jgi:hypothetical protein